MKRLLMVLPGLHGDIIICLPIAKWYADRGWRVTWPTFDRWTYRSLFSHVDYVEPVFIDRHGEDIFKEIDALSVRFDRVIDLYHWENVGATHGASYIKARYKKARVPINERWKLSWKCDQERESALYKSVASNGRPYSLVHDETSQGPIDVGKPRYQIVRVRPIKPYSLFDWRSVIAHASEIRCGDSAFSNFVEVLPEARKIEKHLIYRGPLVCHSLYRSNWEEHQGPFIHRPTVRYGVNRFGFDIDRKLILSKPPPKRGIGRLLILRDDVRGIGEGEVEHLPALLDKHEVWVNRTRARRGRFWLYRDSGHRFAVTLVRSVGRYDWPRTWLASIEGPRDLILDGKYTTSDGTPVEIAAESEWPRLYEIVFVKRPDFRSFANRFQLPNGQGPRATDDLAAHESLWADEEASALTDFSGMRLSEREVKALAPAKLLYGIESSLVCQEGGHAFRDHYALPSAPGEQACAVGVHALAALECHTKTDALSGENGLPEWEQGCKFRTAALLSPLLLPTDRDFKPLAAFVGVRRFAQAYREAVKRRFAFGPYGDLILAFRGKPTL